MIKMIEMLSEKNNYLEKFLGLNREWIDKLAQNDFSELEEFRENRESILNIVHHIDSVIESLSERLDIYEVCEAEKTKVTALLDRKDSLVKAILAQDLEIMQFIDAAKALIITELKKVAKNKKSIGSYKSGSRKDNINENF